MNEIYGISLAIFCILGICVPVIVFAYKMYQMDKNEFEKNH
ncbi:hypothetical protein [Campylobacter sp. MIT 99-7217]|nr:hypothetical protein [Campylobacter sp. MIT 99-7217]